MISEENTYKEKLFQTMQDVGLVDNLKVQIRQKLLDKLKHAKRQTSIEPDLLFVKKLCSSLFIDYLEKNHLNYTVSVFQPESGFSNSLLASNQLAEFFKINRSTNQSVLEKLVGNVLPKRSQSAKTTSTQQQTDDPNSVESIEQKLSMIEHSYKIRANNPVEMLKEAEERQLRQAKYRSDMARRQEDQIKREVKRVREYELNNIRMEERERYNIMVRQYKQELDIKYKEKLAKLNQREEEVIKRVTDKMKQIETHNYQHRQKVLKDMEYIKEKERQLELYRLKLDKSKENEASKMNK